MNVSSKIGQCLFAVAALFAIPASPSQAQGADARAASDPTVEDYAAATKLLRPNLRGLVLNEAVQPHWIGDSGRFWYERDGQDGPEFVVVTSEGVKAPAFDHERLAQALYEAAGEQRSGPGLPVSLAEVDLSDDLTALSGKLGDKDVTCDLNAQRCRVTHSSLAPGEPQAVLTSDDNLVEIPVTRDLLLSPDGRQALLVRDDNLFVRNMLTGEDRPLTTDGTPSLSWANQPFYASFITWSRVFAGVKSPPWHTGWSPDARYVIAPLVDVRGVGLYPYLEMVPLDGSKRPKVHNVPMPLPGDQESVKITYFIFDLVSGHRTAIQLPEGYPELSWPPSWSGVLGWSQSRGQAFILARTPGWKSGAVFRVDIASGRVTKVIEESSPTRVEFHTSWGPSNVRLLGDGAEIVWYSDRTGWAQLYLYDAQTGRLKNAITEGEWAVGDVQAVDETRREIYVSGTGREPGKDLYYRHLYRARLDGRGGLVRLTEADADHHLGSPPAPNGQATSSPRINLAAGVFVDTWSTIDRPPVSELRSTRDGRVIAQLEHADASRLFAAGWVPPVRERVKAADGTTDLYIDYFAPYGRTEGEKYPVVDNAYNGAGSLRTPRNFTEAHTTSSSTGASALTRLGFGVVYVDGRATAGRSRAFRDAGYPAFTQVGIDDHVAAIRQLAQRHAEIDLERVGVYGQSWGGTFAAQAILSYPEFFKVAIATAGEYDYTGIEKGYEQYLGEPVYADGTQYRGSPDEVPTNWGADVNAVLLADRLQGHLLIVHGDLDDQARPNQPALLIDALIKANKPFDYLYIPNGEHNAYFTSYGFKRGWDYFIQHLRGATPVRDFNIGLPGNIRN